MRNHFYIFFLSLSLLAQEKSKVIYKNEIVTISNTNKLKVETVVSERRAIPKSVNTNDYVINIPFDSFNEITDINGSTTNLKNQKKHSLSSSSIRVFDAEHDNIFKSDAKFKQFIFPSVEDNSVVEYSYKNTIKQPRFLSVFRFQNYLKTESARLQIKCDSTVEIGFKIFGNHQEKIKFSKNLQGSSYIYTWEATDLPDFQKEEEMPNPIYFLPHIIYYIKSYSVDGKKEPLLGSTENLYKWYASLLKNVNTTDQSELKKTTLELIKDKTTDFEKAKVIFNWVQQNLHYVAFEDGMGGFIPREAADIHQKLYGDCKDMANLLNQMLGYANLKSRLAWIGTRAKPYSYAELPSPQVDNHMITNLILDGKSYFLDATDKFCPFTYPSAMIQGKEALIGISDSEFTIEKVPIVEAKNNLIQINLNLQLQEKKILGTATTFVSGLFKSDLLNQLSFYTQKANEIWKNTINSSNPKIVLTPDDLIKNEYVKDPSKGQFKLELDDAVKNVNGKLIVKPMFIFPLKEFQIDVEKRNFPIERDFAYRYEINYEYEIPQDYKIEFIPENSKTENELGAFEIQYKAEKNKLIVKQHIESKKVLIQKTEFQQWNAFIKSLNTQYIQSILLTK